MVGEQTAVYICFTKGCKQRTVEVRHPWSGDWPLVKRQKKCRACKVRMLFVRLVRVMTQEAKDKLAALPKRPPRPDKPDKRTRQRRAAKEATYAEVYGAGPDRVRAIFKKAGVPVPRKVRRKK